MEREKRGWYVEGMEGGGGGKEWRARKGEEIYM